jgi:microsomal epoxide hydrolase
MSPDDTAVRPFEFEIDDEDIADLERRLAATRWPDQLADVGWEYGTERDYLQTLCEYWQTEYDWTALEQRINRFEQYTTEIDGQNVHFYHVQSPHASAQPLLLSHGWPGSVVEFLEVLGPLTDPESHSGDPADAFHVVAPSLPGYGFSGPTHERGYDVERISETFARLMDRIGYEEYFAQGGDWGALITALLGANYPERVRAIHTNMLFVRPSDLGDPVERLDEEGMADYRETKQFREQEVGYQEIQSTKPQTLAYGLTDSPSGLAGWIIEKFRTWSDCEDDVESSFTRDRLLDNISVYWLTGTINSSMRLYYETDPRAVIPERVDVPTGHARYPAEISKTPRQWAEEIYDIVYWNEMPEGGHFAAMEVPELFVEDIRDYFGRFR